jgi:uncharacterized protein (TIGR03435 family)
MKRFMVGMSALALAAAVALGQNPAKSDTASSAKPLTFDAVSIKPHQDGDRSMMWRTTPDGYRMVNVDLIRTLEWAYDLNNATEEQVVGLPQWAKDFHFDLDAKVSPDDAAAFKALSDDDKNAMLRVVLEDRFKLKAHKEMRELAIYDLVVAKGGPKLTPADPANTYEQGVKLGDKPVGAGGMTTRIDGTTFIAEFQACGLDRVVPLLTQLAQKNVIDKTGLTGKYDIKLETTPEWVKDDTAVTAPRLLTALPEQLGLKLEPGKGPVESLIVDHVDQPTDN